MQCNEQVCIQINLRVWRGFNLVKLRFLCFCIMLRRFFMIIGKREISWNWTRRRAWNGWQIARQDMKFERTKSRRNQRFIGESAVKHEILICQTLHSRLRSAFAGLDWFAFIGLRVASNSCVNFFMAVTKYWNFLTNQNSTARRRFQILFDSLPICAAQQFTLQSMLYGHDTTAKKKRKVGSVEIYKWP